MTDKKIPKLLVLIGLLLGLHALTSARLAQDPLPPPPPAKDYSPKLWKDFTSTEGGFKVRFPGEPKASAESRPDSGVLHSFSYGSEKFILYSVSYRDLPNPPANQTEARQFLKIVRDIRMAGAEARVRGRESMKLLLEEETTRDGQLAIMLEIQLFDDRRIRELNVIRGKRHYNVFVVTFSNHRAMASDNAYGELARSFLDSFHLIEH